MRNAGGGGKQAEFHPQIFLSKALTHKCNSSALGMFFLQVTLVVSTVWIWGDQTSLKIITLYFRCEDVAQMSWHALLLQTVKENSLAFHLWTALHARCYFAHGYLKVLSPLLQRSLDLKLVVMSQTLTTASNTGCPWKDWDRKLGLEALLHKPWASLHFSGVLGQSFLQLESHTYLCVAITSKWALIYDQKTH